MAGGVLTYTPLESGCSAGRHCLYQLYSQSQFCRLHLPQLEYLHKPCQAPRTYHLCFQQLASLGFLIVSVEVDLGLSLHWKSLESRLKMQEILTVRVTISSQAVHTGRQSCTKTSLSQTVHRDCSAAAEINCRCWGGRHWSGNLTGSTLKHWATWCNDNSHIQT